MTSLQSAPEPVVGVFGLRTFRVSANGYLLPLSFTSADWADGTCIARCGLGHAAPADGCTCGIYSLRDLRDLRLQYWSARRLVAVVALEGQAVEGSKGWRSQAARVVDVWTGTGRRGLPAEQMQLLRRHLPGVRFHADMGGMLAGYPELVPVRRPRSALFARAARSWWSSVTRPRLPARRFAVWAAAAVLLTAVLCVSPAGSAVVAGQLAAALLVLAVVVMLCESPTQLLTVLIAGASPPLLLTPRRPVLRLFRPSSVLLTAGAAASVLTGLPFPATDVAVSAAGWAVLLTVERFMLGLAPSTSPVRIVGFARGAHPGAGRRREWAPERRTTSGHRFVLVRGTRQPWAES
ncbi:hypothetical protein ACVBEQ_27050, partial [Nakamurella sp. GG22]